MNIIHARELCTLEEAQHIREIRNNARRSMTRHNSIIMPAQQKVWYENYMLDQENQCMYLYHNEHDCLVGYGYVVLRDGKYWGSLVVKPEFQGIGIGKRIYQDMIANYYEMWIEIFSDNAESLNAAIKSGFQHVYVTDNIVVMRGANDTTI